MSEEVTIDQEVYDRLIAEGKSERIARAKAKAAAVRKAKEASGETLGPRSAEELAAKAAGAGASAGAAAAASAGGADAGQGGGVATLAPPAARTNGNGDGNGNGAPARLTPEQRAARVAASLGKGGESASVGVPAASTHTHRMLALVPPSGIQQVKTTQDDKVYTWPHLLLVEFVALLAVGAVVLLVSFFLDAPLGSLANANEVPAINKAPWYFMGLQELLRYFHPMVAGVTMPGVVIVVLMAAPYVDKNPSAQPENRKVANMAFTFFLVFWAVLVIIGSFIRGAGYEWVWPWVSGLGFVL
jgi:menaquinol-cytochrome c reductase cytochrome b/c subunit